jgi:hypothetical protein
LYEYGQRKTYHQRKELARAFCEGGSIPQAREKTPGGNTTDGCKNEKNCNNGRQKEDEQVTGTGGEGEEGECFEKCVNDDFEEFGIVSEAVDGLVDVIVLHLAHLQTPT